MRRFIALIFLLVLTAAALWFYIPRWIPHVVAALLPENISLISVEADRPRRSSWTIRSLHLVHTSSQTEPAPQAPQLYHLLRRGPIDDLNALLANYKIEFLDLLVEMDGLRWRGSGHLGEEQLALNLAGQLDSHNAVLSAHIDLPKRVLKSDISIGDQVQMTASIMPSTSTLQSGTESKLEFSLNSAFTDVLIQEGQAMQFGVPAPKIPESEIITATSAELHLSGALDYRNDSFSLTLAEHSHSVMKNLRSNELKIPRLLVALRAPAELTLKQGELLLAPLRFTTNNLRVLHQGTELPRVRVTGDISLHNNIASGAVHIASRIPELSEQLTVSVPFSHRLDSGIGRGAVHTRPMHFSEQQRFLPNLIPGWQWPTDLVGGELILSGQLRWDPSTITAKLDADLNNIDGFYRKLLIYGINGKLKLNWPATDKGIGLISITAEQLQAGMVLSNLQLSAEFSNELVSISSAQMSMFNGTFSISDININPKNIEFSNVIKLEDINLAELLSVEQGVEGTGIVDGELPIMVSARSVTMSNGQLRARPPGGVIRYTGSVPKAAIDSSPQMQLAVDALKNFHYKVLDITASYAENGTMTLGVRLEGRNPDLKNSRPINFNLNVSEDVPSLIKSLMLTREISDGLQKRIEQNQG